MRIYSSAYSHLLRLAFNLVIWRKKLYNLNQVSFQSKNNQSFERSNRWVALTILKFKIFETFVSKYWKSKNLVYDSLQKQKNNLRFGVRIRCEQITFSKYLLDWKTNRWLYLQNCFFKINEIFTKFKVELQNLKVYAKELTKLL